MPRLLHPAIRLLVDEVRARLRAPELPDSAIRGAMLQALRASDPPQAGLTTWLEAILAQTAREVCRRLGIPPVSPPSLAGLVAEPEPRDLAAELVQALLEDLDPQVVSVLRQLEVRDAREAQVAVRLGLPPKRIGVMARHGRAEVRDALIRHAG